MLSIPEHLRSVANSDGAVIRDTSNNQITTLNSTGSLIWCSLQDGHSPSEIARSISASSNTNLSTVEREVNSFVEELKERSLLIESQPSTIEVVHAG